jgi:hypothetical protein
VANPERNPTEPANGSRCSVGSPSSISSTRRSPSSAVGRSRLSSSSSIAAIPIRRRHRACTRPRRALEASVLWAVVGYFMRRTGSPEVAADLAAEVFAQALAAAGRYRPHGVVW